jgi:Zn ribbon nucleic-acid-binding protein
MTSPNHILTEVSKELKAPWLFSKSEQRLEKCFGYNVDQKGRCIYNVAKLQKAIHKERAEELLVEFEAIKTNRDDTNDKLLEVLEEFIELTHCGYHWRRALKECNGVWNKHKGQANTSQSQTCHHNALSSRSSERDDNSGKVTDYTYDVPGNTESDSSEAGPGLGDDVGKATEHIPDYELSKEGLVCISTTELQEDDSINQVAQSVSVLDIEDETDDVDPADLEPPPIETSGASGRVVEIDVVNKFFSLGIVEMHRSGSFRDSSPVYREIHRPLTGQDMSMGIVYILQQNRCDDLFKIGWTRFTTAERQRHHNNCYSIDSKVIYESDAHFQAARRAESLCHRILRHKNVRVKECKHCGGGHREWFTASGEEVRRTVSIIEALVRLPAYVLQNGKMRLSPQAYVLIEGMSKFNLDKLGESLGRSVQDSFASESTLLSPTETLQDAAEIALNPDQPLASIEDGSPQSPPGSAADAATPVTLGAMFGMLGINAKGFWENRARTSTPEEAEGGRRRLSMGTLKKKATAQRDALRQELQTFLQDFEREYKKGV